MSGRPGTETATVVADPAQRLVLTAATAELAEAVGAWRTWRGLVDLDDIDFPSLRLMPRVYRRIATAAGDDPDLDRIKGIYRMSWSRSQMLIGAAGAVAERWRTLGIESMVLKGGALTASGLAGAGERWLADVDLLVRPADADRAHEVLLELGWNAHDVEPSRLMSIQHATAYDNGSGQAIDMHWRSLWLPADDDPVWGRSGEAELAGMSVRLPSPADQLVGACVHGATWFPSAQLDWLTDITVLAGGAGIDWDAVVAETRRRRAGPWVSAGLAYASAALSAQVPPEVIDEVDAAAGARDRRLYREVHRRHSFRRTLRIAREVHRRYSELDVPGPREPSLWAFMKGTMRHDRGIDLATHGARRALQSSWAAIARRGDSAVS